MSFFIWYSKGYVTVWSYLDQLAKIPHLISFSKNKHVDNTEK